MATITKKREEILRLISRVTNSGATDPATAPARLPRPKHERAARRQSSLERTREQRELLERRLLGEQLLQLHQLLEQRVAAIEETLQTGLVASTEKEPDGGATASAQIERFERSTLSGAIKEGLLADLLQMVSSNMMTGVFCVESDGTEVNLYFDEGEVFHGAGEGLVADNAFFAAMAMEHGRFYFTETTELPQERTISSKTQFLILEALRQIDESKAQH